MHYRAYPLGPDGHYPPPIERDCEADAEALAARPFFGRFRLGPDDVVEGGV